MSLRRSLSKRSSRLIATLFTLLLIGIAVAIYVRRPQAGERYLIIHADDAGMNEIVNLATIDAMERGVVSSASIMVPCPAFDEFAEYAASHPERDFGVHLTLTCELKRSRWGPVLPKEKVPSLVDRDGNFWPTVEQVAQHAKLEEAEAELQAQIDRAKAAGIYVSHLDHHMYVLFTRPDLLALYVRLGIDKSLPIRISKVPPTDDIVERGQAMVDTYKECRDRAARNGLPILDYVESDNYFVEPEDKQQFYLSQLKRLPNGLSEFVVHCAYVRRDGPPIPNVAGREADTRAFLSPEVKREIERQGIILTNHGKLRPDPW